MWTIARSNPKLLKQCAVLLDAIGQFVSRPFVRQCKLCELRTENLIAHNICICTESDYNRMVLWSDFCELLGYNEFRRLTQMDVIEQSALVLKYATCTDNGSLKYAKLSKDVVNLVKPIRYVR